jgi:transposase
MRSPVERHSEQAEQVVRDIRRAARRQYSAEEKVRIVIAGLRGEDSIAELCRKEGINQNLYYRIPTALQLMHFHSGPLMYFSLRR